MIVYLAMSWWTDCDDHWDCIGVFSTATKARKYLKAHPHRARNSMEKNPDSMDRVDKFEVDKE